MNPLLSRPESPWSIPAIVSRLANTVGPMSSSELISPERSVPTRRALRIALPLGATERRHVSFCKQAALGQPCTAEQTGDPGRE